MDKLIIAMEQSFCAPTVSGLSWPLWPEAEDRALRGRNLSAVFRTLYRQVGKPPQRLPSCAQTWRVENPCDKSTLQTPHPPRLTPERRPKNLSLHSHFKYHPTQLNYVSIFSGQAHYDYLKMIAQIRKGELVSP